MKKLLLAVFVMLCITSVYADNYFSVSQFNDGTTEFNITTNTTKYITLPTNATYINATLTLTGFLSDTDIWQFQENTTGIISTGACLDAGNLTDSNYSTWSSTTSGAGDTCYWYMNYTKPENSLSGSRWQIKYGALTLNTTISSDCWDAYEDKIVLRVMQEYVTGDYDPYFYCDTGSTWYLLGSGNNVRQLYEEGVWWKKHEYPENVTIKVNNTIEFNHPVNLSGTNSSISINDTIGDYTKSNGTLPITFTADNWGVLQVSNLLIYYEDVWACDGRGGESIAYNFTLTDEDNFTILTGDISADLTYQENTLSFENEDVSSLAICIGGSNNYSINGTIQGDVGYSHKYYLTDTPFTTNTQNINLYNFGDSTGESTLQWTLRDYTWSEYPNIIGKLQRYYPQNHTWLTVQQDKTGEFGQVIFHIKEETTDYKLYWYDHATLLDNTDSIKFVCTSGLCQVESQVQYTESALVDVKPTYSFNNVSKLLTISWNDATNAISYVNITVRSDVGATRTIICNTSAFTTAGSYDCNTTGYVGYVWVHVLAAASPENIQAVDRVPISGLPQMSDVLDFADANFWTFGFTLVIVSLGIIGSPISVMVMLAVALFIQLLFGMTTIINTSFVVGAAIVGIVIALKVRQ